MLKVKSLRLDSKELKTKKPANPVVDYYFLSYISCLNPVLESFIIASSESPSYHTGSSEPPNDLILPPMGGSIDTSDRRLRRQIANCNERRRMQSINAGFQSLKLLLPRRDGEKLSKAAVLQQTVELIQTLRAEKMKLIEEKESVINAKKRKIQDENTRERSIIDELTTALEYERRLRQLYERVLNLWVHSPFFSHLLLKPSGSLINSAVALQNMIPPLLQDRGFTGLVSPSLFIHSLLNSAGVINNRSNGSKVDDMENGTGQQQQMANIDVIKLSSNPMTEVPGTFTQLTDSSKSASHRSQPAAVDLLTQPPPFFFNSVSNTNTTTNLNPNFYTILEAIRQLEESTSGDLSDSKVNQQKQQQQTNVLVR
ncbi:unnamed protein product [Thelazia callipaeda]|uniref:BHLH domain-containing protein n=1 Tax=Thelazia callipaeda TaxID=103827 RepID=A0A0N5D1P6_THECL|nr:unnamed protein product [Thelazia callipaeda]